MTVSKETVIHTSRLARLDLSAGVKGVGAEERIDAFAAQMNAIVGYIDILQEADTTGIEPMFSPMSRTAPLRPDELRQEYTREEALANAPEQADGFFVVPRVL